jgi:hypothetical protein
MPVNNFDMPRWICAYCTQENAWYRLKCTICGWEKKVKEKEEEDDD